MTEFFEQLGFVLGGMVPGALFLAALLTVAVLVRTGVLRPFFLRSVPGSPTAALLVVAVFGVLLLGITVYRTIWGEPDRPVLAFMLPLIGSAIVLAGLAFWLMAARRPPRWTIPVWLREDAARAQRTSGRRR